MAHKAAGLAGSWAGFDIDAPRNGDWQFAQLLPVMAADPDGADPRARDLGVQLGVSNMLFGKVWKLIPALSAIAVALAAALVIAAGYWLFTHWQSAFLLRYEFSVGDIVIAAAILAAGILLPLAQFIRPLETFRKWLFMIVPATVGCILTNLYLWILDPLFKWRGRLARLLKLGAG